MSMRSASVALYSSSLAIGGTLARPGRGQLRTSREDEEQEQQHEDRAARNTDDQKIAALEARSLLALLLALCIARCIGRARRRRLDLHGLDGGGWLGGQRNGRRANG